MLNHIENMVNRSQEISVRLASFQTHVYRLIMLFLFFIQEMMVRDSEKKQKDKDAGLCL